MIKYIGRIKESDDRLLLAKILDFFIPIGITFQLG